MKTISLFRKSFWVLTLTALISACGTGTEKQEETTENNAGEVNVYTHRHYDSDEILFQEFTRETGIKVNVIKAGADQLQQRLEMEGAESPADVLLTVDAGRLFRAKEKGLLQAVSSAVLEANLPANMRDAEGYWFALTQRARVIVYNKATVKPEDLSDYEALTNARWKKKVLVRPSENIYNQSLLASIVAHLGEEAALNWTKGMVANFARAPKGNDRDQIQAVAAGEGDVALVNTYYLAQMIATGEIAEKEAAAKVGVFFPNQNGRGTHMNISGGGVAKYSPNRENAVKLLEFLTTEKAQKIFAESNQEYPVRTDVPVSEILQGWGTFKMDTIDFSLLGKHNTDAVKIFDMAGWK